MKKPVLNINWDDLTPCPTREEIRKQKRELADKRVAKAKAEGRYMENQRDYQKQRVYNAEWRWAPGLERETEQRIAYEDAIQYCHEILESDFVVKQFGIQEPITFKPGRNGQTAWADSWNREILLPQSCRLKWLVVHEMSHILAPMGERHGKEFVKTYLYMVGNVFGEDEMRVLANLMNEEGVMW